jgi:hypothetical protein
MRGRKNKRRETGLVARRYVLAGLLVASSQASLQAETQVIATPVPLSPLPLIAGEGDSAAALNPFCQFEDLKTVGLKTAGHGERPSGLPKPIGLLTSPGSETSWVGASPYVFAAHNESTLATGRVVPVAGEETRPVGRPSGAGVRTAIQPIVAGGQVAGGVRANPIALVTTHSSLPTPIVIGSSRVKAKSVSMAAPQDPAGGPVSFSLTDDANEFESIGEAEETEEADECGSDDSPSEAYAIGPVVRPAIDADETVELRPKHRPAQAWRGSESGFPAPVTIEPMSERGVATGKTLPVPLTDEVGDAGIELQRVESRPVVDSGERLVNGGHRRVEVGRPPVVVDRLATTSLLAVTPRLLVVDADSDASQTGRGESLASQPTVSVAAPTRDLPIASESPALAVDTQSDHPAGGSLLVPAAASGTGAQTLADVPVAVDRVKPSPVIVGATASQRPAVAELSPTPAVEEPEVFVSRLRLKPTEVRSLKLDRPIVSAVSDDLKVCAVIQTGPSQVQLIATGQGTAKLAVIAAGENGKEDVENYEVTVGDMRTSQVESPEATAATLTQTARSAFPGSEVRVAYQSGRFVVTGMCTDEGSARRMLRMIRAASSMPVDDKLTVR